MIGIKLFYPGSFAIGWEFLGKHNDEGEYEVQWFELKIGFFAFAFFIGDM